MGNVGQSLARIFAGMENAETLLEILGLQSIDALHVHAARGVGGRP